MYFLKKNFAPFFPAPRQVSGVFTAALLLP